MNMQNKQSRIQFFHCPMIDSWPVPQQQLRNPQVSWSS